MGFAVQIVKGWSISDRATPKNVMESLKNLKGPLLVWSKKVFGVIPKEIKKLRQLILKLRKTRGIILS